MPFISASLYLLCAGIHRELALACAWVKKIFHLNISTFCYRLRYIHHLLVLCDTNIISAGIHRKPALVQLCKANNYFLRPIINIIPSQTMFVGVHCFHIVFPMSVCLSMTLWFLLNNLEMQ